VGLTAPAPWEVGAGQGMPQTPEQALARSVAQKQSSGQLPRGPNEPGGFRGHYRGWDAYHRLMGRAPDRMTNQKGEDFSYKGQYVGPDALARWRDQPQNEPGRVNKGSGNEEEQQRMMNALQQALSIIE